MRNLRDALIFLAKTGSQNDSQRAISLNALLYPPKGRAGRPDAPIQLGGPIVCVDYSSQSVSIGTLFRTGVDFGEISRLWGKHARPLSEQERKERNQCVILHRVAAYEWALHVVSPEATSTIPRPNREHADPEGRIPAFDDVQG